MDSFSKKIICIYSIGFLSMNIFFLNNFEVKTILWLLLALDLMGEEINGTESLNPYRYTQNILEDAINLVF